MAGEKKSVAEKVFEIVSPIAKEQNLEIWDIKYLKEGASYFLRIFIDKPEGITIDDCEEFSRAIDEPLDLADPISEAYFLEVSSPGLNRELSKDEHFKAFIGEEIIVKLYKAIDKKKELIGKLLGFENGELTIEYNGQPFKINKKEISKINLNDFEF